MGLLTKEVEITLNGKNFKHLESRGYELPRRKDKVGRICVPHGSKIMVKVQDLLPCSQVNVKIKCDCCGKEKEVSYQSYKQNNHDGKCYCKKCSSKGDRNPNWNFNKTDHEREIGRNLEGYSDFVKSVLIRDNYTCKCCEKTNVKLEVHHLDGYNWCIEGRMDQKNAVTLCEHCHDNFHSKYGYGDNTKEQYEEWIGHTLDDLTIYNGELPTNRQIYCIEEDKVYSSAKEIADVLNISRTQIYDICNRVISTSYYISKNGVKVEYQYPTLTAKGKHFLWHDEYLKMSEDEIKCILNKKRNNEKPIICTTTKKVFKTSTSASRYYKCSKNIYKCCRGENKFCGKDENGHPLHWMYYEDYLKENNMTNEEARNSLFFVDTN